VVRDVAVQLARADLSPTQVVGLSRIATLAITAVALLPLLSSGGQKLVDSIVAYAWGGLGATFGPTLILALWWKKTSGRAALAGMITGLVATIAWKNLTLLAALVDLKIATFALALLAVMVTSMLRPARA
jgi:sodium/proline symporter